MLPVGCAAINFCLLSFPGGRARCIFVVRIWSVPDRQRSISHSGSLFVSLVSNVSCVKSCRRVACDCAVCVPYSFHRRLYGISVGWRTCQSSNIYNRSMPAPSSIACLHFWRTPALPGSIVQSTVIRRRGIDELRIDRAAGKQGLRLFINCCIIIIMFNYFSFLGRS